MHDLNSPTTYIYCLVDSTNSRFKLSMTSYKHYAVTLQIAYCPSQSFQVGYLSEYAKVVWEVLLEKYVDQRLTGDEGEEDQVWFPMVCFNEIRATLSDAGHTVEPTLIVMVDPQRVNALACAEFERILGLTDKN